MAIWTGVAGRVAAGAPAGRGAAAAAARRALPHICHHLVERAEDYRTEYNEVRPHEAIAWNRPLDVHLGLADPTIPNFEREEILPTT